MKTRPSNDARSASDLLYDNAWGGLSVSALAASGLATTVLVRGGPHDVLIWLGAMIVVLLARAADVASAPRRRRAATWSEAAELRRFGIGVVASSIAWAAFAIWFFPRLDTIDRVTTAAVLSAMVGGSVTVLAASRPLTIVYCIALLVPSATMFLLTPGVQNTILGVLGYVFGATMIGSSRVTHRAVMGAIQLTDELLSAEAELREALTGLEDRVAERTQELATMATHDALTGLLNRTAFGQRLDETLERTVRHGSNLALFFVDLDNFKDINDTLGHDVGDVVLLEVSARIRNALSEDAFCARWGGDEFIICFPDVPVGGTASIGMHLWRRLRDRIDLAGERMRIDAAIGVALAPAHGTTADEIIRAADLAMYAAKQRGRGRVRTFERSMTEAPARRRLIESALRDAVVEGRFSIEYQPIVRGADGAPVVFEALARWHDPALGHVAPSEFIPIAERSGDVVAIGRWVLEHACRAATQWHAERPPAVAVNVSIAQIVAGSLLSDVRAALDASGLDPVRLHVEVTESLFAGEREHTIAVLRQLRALGISVLLDDFGTGYSSMGYLGSLPIDALKIDQTFVARLDGDGRPIIEAITSLSRAFELDVIAEGVESEKQAEKLRALGVPLIQGYWIARPLPPGDVQTFLDDPAGAASRLIASRAAAQGSAG